MRYKRVGVDVTSGEGLYKSREEISDPQKNASQRGKLKAREANGLWWVGVRTRKNEEGTQNISQFLSV